MHWVRTKFLIFINTNLLLKNYGTPFGFCSGTYWLRIKLLIFVNINWCYSNNIAYFKALVTEHIGLELNKAEAIYKHYL